MNIKNFRSGRYVKQTEYKSFLPEKINHSWVVSDPGLLMLLDEATRKLGELNSFAQVAPDVDAFIRMHVVKEATTSSKIEGTETQLEEAVLKRSQVAPEKRNDWQEVQNYIRAMNFAIRQLDKLPLSNRLFRDTHRILMEGARGMHKAPGEFRRTQNWIGGASLKDARFVPPHQTDVEDLMGDLEKFLHNQEIQIPHLVRVAIAHYQFETIHPFLDGNGRLGRLLITLYLVSNGLMEKPALYLSQFFEKNRQLYYDNLSGARQRNELAQWIRFFLVGVSETAEMATSTLKKILNLKKNIEEKKITTLGKRYANALELMNLLYSKPVISAQDIIGSIHVSAPTAHKLINDLIQLGILKEQTGFKRNRVFIFEEYLELFEKK